MDLPVRSRYPHNYEGRCIYIRSLLGYMFLHSYKDWECSTVEFHNEVQSIPAYTRSHKKNPLVHKYHCFYKDLGGTHFFCMFFRLHDNFLCTRSALKCIRHLDCNIDSCHLHSCGLQRARCICKYTPLHSAENQQRKDWNISPLRSYHCVESRCQCMFLRVDKGVINRN